MAITTRRSNWTIGLVCFLSAAWSWITGCGNSSNPSSTGNAGATSVTTGGNTAGGGAATGGVAPSTLPCISASTGPRPHDFGNYDYRSCNGVGCHEDYTGGGWVYASATGVPWIAGATVTITNNDGTTKSAVSGTTGFFYLDYAETDTTTGPYVACASKCPTTYCSTTTHTNRDCLASGCHSSPTQRIFVGSGAGTGGAGGTGGSSAGTTNCTPPASGGPYVHPSRSTGETPCSYGGCHNTPIYNGGFVFDGITSDTSVGEATVTVTPSSGPTLTAVTGPDGMFFLGTRNGVTSAPFTLSAPYTTCVSKCPKIVCSTGMTNHTTTDDCSTCHDSSNRIYLQ